ncbi:MAG: hypothetical protein WCD87_09200, partial [Pseudolabrys sp.]
LERNSPQQNEAESLDEIGVSRYSMRLDELACQRLQMDNYINWNDERPNLRPTPKSAPRNTVETAARPARSKINER